MSAYILSDNHINTLLNGLITTDKSPQELGQILRDENVRSVNYLYKEESEVFPFIFKIAPPLSAVEILKCCNCYDYQSSECPDYRETKAAKIIEKIRHQSIQRLTGYDQAKWSIE